MAAFNYEELTGPSDIRLLKLQPGQGAEPVMSSLMVYSLDDREYGWHALSYTWGNPHDRRKITCDGHQISVTANLHSALQRVRLADKPMMIWVDAVCINQENTKEKESQVQLMRRIYSRAYIVVADIGEVEDDHDDVATIFNALQDLVQTTAASERIDYERYEAFGLPAYTDSKWESWRRFLARAWFCRIWVVQEYALGCNVIMMYGSMNLDGERLPALIDETMKRLPPSIVAGADSYAQQHNANTNCAAMVAMLTIRRDIQANRHRG